MENQLEAARERVRVLIAAVQAAHAARDTATDEGERRGAEAELRLQREALEVARGDLAQLEKRSRCEAQERFEAELQETAARVLADVDGVLAGALALHRAVSIAEGRGLRVGSERRPTLPRDVERALQGWRDRLRRIAGGREADRDYDDAA